MLAWALINNNVLTASMATIISVLDLVLQFLLIFCSCESTYSHPLDSAPSLSSLSALLELHDYQYGNFISLVVLASICLGFFLASIVIVLRRHRESYFKEKNALFKLLSITVQLFKNVILTFAFLVLTCNFSSLESQASIFNIIQLALLAINYLLVCILVYCSGYLVNLVIPNQLLHWAELSERPFFIECIAKYFICLTFAYRDRAILRYVFTAIAILTTSYKIFYRIKSSFIFNRLMRLTSLVLDSLLLYMLLFSLLSFMFTSKSFYLSAAICALFPPLVIILLNHQFSIQWTIQNANCLATEEDKLKGLLIMITMLSQKSQTSLDQLSQILYSHFLSCKTYENKLEDFLKAKIALKNQPSEESESQNNFDFTQGYELNNIIVEEPDEEVKSEQKDECNLISEIWKVQTNDNKAFSTNPRGVTFQKSQGSLTSLDNKSVKSFSRKNSSLSRSRSQSKFISTFNKLKSSTNVVKIQDTHKIQERQIMDQKREKMKSLVRHFFKWHFYKDKIKDFRLLALRIYFTLRIMNNQQQLAHFLIVSFIKDHNSGSMITRLQKMLHQQYFETFIAAHSSSDGQINKLDLQKMLDINQMLAQFESSLERLSLDIQTFWSNMHNMKNIDKIYDHGLSISQALKNVFKLYVAIEEKQQERKDTKIYYLMGAFNKYVIAKDDEYLLQLQKIKQTVQIRHMNKNSFGLSNDTDQKGLLITKIDLKKPMEISFINKRLCQLIELDAQKAVGMKINSIMPQLIAEQHHSFVEQFMKNGKNGMIEMQRRVFIKQKSGHVIPATSYLSMNHLDFTEMILLVDYDSTFNPFGEQTNNLPVGIIVTDNKFRVYEISRNVTRICKLQRQQLEKIASLFGLRPDIDELFASEQQDSSTMKSLIEDGIFSFEVSTKFEQLIQQYAHHMQQSDDEEEQSCEFIGNATQQMSQLIKVSRVGFSTRPSSYIMRLLDFRYANKTVNFQVFAIRKMVTQENYIGTTTATIPTFNKLSSIKSPKASANGDTASSSDIGICPQFNISQASESHERNGMLDIKSHSSTASTSSCGQRQVLYQMTNKNEKIPLTLKFILQIMLIALVLVLVTSSVSLGLTLVNISNAQSAIDVTQWALLRQNTITDTRLETRVLFNIPLNIAPNTNSIINDRFTFYETQILRNNDRLRDAQVMIDQKDTDISPHFREVKLAYLSSKNKLQYEDHNLQQSINTYIDYIDEIFKQTRSNGMSILNTSNYYFNLGHMKASPTASLIDRMGVFLIENGNQDLYNAVQEFTEMFRDSKVSAMNTKIRFQEIMTWICISIIFISGVSAIPMLGRIQTRIVILMKAFFKIKDADLQKRLSEIEIFLKALKNKSKSNKSILDIIKDAQIEKSLLQQTLQQNDQQPNEPAPLPSSGIPQSMNQDLNFESTVGKLQVRNQAESQYNRQESSISPHVPNPAAELPKELDQEEKSKKKGKKRRSSKKDKTKSQEQEAESFESQESQLITQFSAIIKKRKIIQSVVIMFIALALISYFLGTYFMSVKDLQKMQNSIKVLYTLLLRKPCAENLIHAVRESYIFGVEYFINNGKDEIMEYFQAYCESIEADYLQQVVIERPDYLNDASEVIAAMEDKRFCDYFFSDGDDGYGGKIIDAAKCKEVGGGIALTGLTNIIQTIQQTTRQLRINFFSDLSQYSDAIPPAVAKARMKILFELYDIVEVLMFKPKRLMKVAVLSSITEFFQGESTRFIIIFSIFMTIIVALFLAFMLSKCPFTFQVTLFLLEIFKNLKHEMLQANRLLYILDYNTISDSDMGDINRFLNSY